MTPREAPSPTFSHLLKLPLPPAPTLLPPFSHLPQARLATLREEQAAAHTAAYAQYLHEAKHVLALSPSRITTHLKYQALPDPHRSTATPLETGAPSRAPEAQQAGQAAGSASASPPAASHSPLHSPLHSRLHSRAAGEGIATDGWPEDDTWPEGDEEERSKALAASRLQALLRGRSASSRAQLAATRLAADVAGGLTAELLQVRVLLIASDCIRLHQIASDCIVLLQIASDCFRCLLRLTADLLQGTTELAWRGHRSFLFPLIPSDSL